jgi:MFS family permease
MASRLAMDQLLRRFGWQRVLVACLAISCVALALIPTTATPVLLIMIALGLGLGIGMTQPMTITWVANRAPRGERGTALAVRLTGNRTSLLFFPALMGAVAGSAGVAAVFWVVAAMLGMGSLVAHRAQLTRSDETGEASADEAAAPEPGVAAGGTTTATAGGAVEAPHGDASRDEPTDRAEAPPARPAGT